MLFPDSSARIEAGANADTGGERGRERERERERENARHGSRVFLAVETAQVITRVQAPRTLPEDPLEKSQSFRNKNKISPPF